MRLTLFGNPKLMADDQAVSLKSHKGLALLAYLAIERITHSRDSIATLLWPEFNQSRARANLRRTLSALNKSPVRDWLQSDRDTITLHLEERDQVDVVAFSQLLANGSIEDLEQAVALYQADFLANFYVPDSELFEIWATTQREQLRRQALEALSQLSDYYLDHNAFSRAEQVARRQLSLDPLHEPAYRQLMQVYAQTGRQAEALRQYQLCVQTLLDELDVTPSQETTALYKHIRSGGFDRDPAPLPATAPRPRHNLPAQTTPFIGRETELAELTHLFNDLSNRLVSILGPGGIGKTRLALELAARQVELYPHGVYFTALAPLQNAAQIIPALAEAIDFQLQEDDRSPKQQLLDHLSQKEMLLVLDNFEHLLDGAELLHDILQAGPGIRNLGHQSRTIDPYQ